MQQANERRMGSNVTDEELEDIKKAVRADETLWSYFLRHAVWAPRERGPEDRDYEILAKRVRPDANGSAIAVAMSDLFDEAARSQGLEPNEADEELRSLIMGAPETGWRFPKDPHDLVDLVRRRIAMRRTGKDPAHLIE